MCMPRLVHYWALWCEWRKYGSGILSTDSFSLCWWWAAGAAPAVGRKSSQLFSLSHRYAHNSSVVKMGKSKAHQHRDIKEGGEFVNIRPPPPTCYIVVGTAQLSSAGCWMDGGLASASAGLKQWQFRWQDTLSTLTFNVGRSFVRSVFPFIALTIWHSEWQRVEQGMDMAFVTFSFSSSASSSPPPFLFSERYEQQIAPAQLLVYWIYSKRPSSTHSLSVF